MAWIKACGGGKPQKTYLLKEGEPQVSFLTGGNFYYQNHPYQEYGSCYKDGNHIVMPSGSFFCNYGTAQTIVLSNYNSLHVKLAGYNYSGIGVKFCTSKNVYDVLSAQTYSPIGSHSTEFTIGLDSLKEFYSGNSYYIVFTKDDGRQTTAYIESIWFE